MVRNKLTAKTLPSIYNFSNTYKTHLTFEVWKWECWNLPQVGNEQEAVFRNTLILNEYWEEIEERNSPNLISLTARLLKAVVLALLTTTPSFAVTLTIEMELSSSFQEGVLSPCTFHRRPDQAGKTVWTESSGEIFQCAKKFFNNLFLRANQNFVRQRPYTDILKLTLFRREPFSLFFLFTSLSLVKIEPLASTTLK